MPGATAQNGPPFRPFQAVFGRFCESSGHATPVPRRCVSTDITTYRGCLREGMPQRISLWTMSVPPDVLQSCIPRQDPSTGSKVTTGMYTEPYREDRFKFCEVNAMSDSQRRPYEIRCVSRGNLILWAIVVTALSLPLHAQEVSASLTGRVTDPSGGAVVGAVVTARDQERGTSWSAVTNEGGIYAYPRIPGGTYRLKVEAPGFKTYTHPDIVLEVNQRGRIDVALQLGSVSDSIEVSSEAAVLQTETTLVSAVVSAQTL